MVKYERHGEFELAAVELSGDLLACVAGGGYYYRGDLPVLGFTNIECSNGWGNYQRNISCSYNDGYSNNTVCMWEGASQQYNQRHTYDTNTVCIGLGEQTNNNTGCVDSPTGGSNVPCIG